MFLNNYASYKFLKVVICGFWPVVIIRLNDTVEFHHRLRGSFSLDFAFSVLSQAIGWEERVQNDLFCVEWDVKPQLNQSCCCSIPGQSWLELVA